jgi:hypothetical protein
MFQVPHCSLAIPLTAPISPFQGLPAGNLTLSFLWCTSGDGGAQVVVELMFACTTAFYLSKKMYFLLFLKSFAEFSSRFVLR